MSGPLSVLLRVKQLKEDQAFRALQRKRREVADGEVAVDTAKLAVKDSAATLPAREDAIYAGILGRRIDLTRLDETRGAVVVLEKGHATLVDQQERTVHILARLEQELDESRQTHRLATKTKDKYVLLTDAIHDEATTEALLKEESETEEMFGGRRRKTG